MSSAENWVAGTVEKMTPGYNLMVNKVKTVASFSCVKGMEMARYMAASSTSGYHWAARKLETLMKEYSVEVVEVKTMASAALDYFQASDALQVNLFNEGLGRMVSVSSVRMAKSSDSPFITVSRFFLQVT